MSSSILLNAVDLFDRAIHIDSVAREDIPQYALCSNLWVELVRDCTSLSVAKEMQFAINTHGLYKCIQTADAYAKSVLQLIADEQSDSLPFRSGLDALWSKVVTSLDPDCLTGHGWGVGTPSADMITAFACQVVLRFPKRFTIVSPDTKASMEDFKSIAADDRVFSHRTWLWPGQCVLSHVRQCFRSVMFGSKPRKSLINKAIRKYMASSGYFSNGSLFYPNLINRSGDSYFTSKVPAIKWGYKSLVLRDVWCGEPCRGHVYCGSTLTSKYCVAPSDIAVALVMAVPKDYETSRMIAPETPYLNYEGHRVREFLLELATISGSIMYMNPEDQSINRSLARKGSMMSRSTEDVVWDTLDLSHASDSIVRSLFFAVYPQELHGVTRCALTDYIYVDGAKVATPMLATSGSVLTPFLQSAFYLALGWCSCDMVGLDRTAVYVYNDDIVCDHRVTATLKDLLSSFHLTVNEKKSFEGNHPFRESCGGEYLCGVDVTGVYWPRKALRFPASGRLPAETISALVAMQHRLYGFPSARLLIEQCVQERIPDFTYSPVGSDCEDFWGIWVDDYTSMCSPHYVQATEWNTPTLGWRDARALANEGRFVLERLEYNKFLMDGPSYPDDLCRLLGVSQRSENRMHSMQRGSTSFVLQKPLIRETW